MNELFFCFFALLIAIQLWWGIRILPREGWQIMAAVPSRLGTDGSWQGINLTYYGFFNANAYILAILLFLVLLQGAGGGLGVGLAAAVGIVGCCAPASRIIARMVEKKSYTFTVGGASFLGLIMAPPFFLVINAAGDQSGFGILPVPAALAALTIAYTLGEGLGRLACLSFGCCYGKRLDHCPAALRRIFVRFHTRFAGRTKKASYEGDLEGQPLIPIQAMTCSLYTITSLIGVYLFLHGEFASAFLLTLWVSQLWRVASEFLRADYRGGGRLSAYQLMALASLVYGTIIIRLLPGAKGIVVDLSQAFGTLWNPVALVLLQLAWLAVFLYTGKSMTTGSRISFHVHRHLT